MNHILAAARTAENRSPNAFIVPYLVNHIGANHIGLLLRLLRPKPRWLTPIIAKPIGQPFSKDSSHDKAGFPNSGFTSPRPTYRESNLQGEPSGSWSQDPSQSENI